MKMTRTLKISRMAILLAVLVLTASVSADSDGKGGGKGRSNSSDRGESSRSKNDKDDKDRDDDNDDKKDSDRGKLEDRLGKIGELVPEGERGGFRSGERNWDRDSGKSDDLPPGIEAILNDDKHKNAPPAWGVWKREERLDWLKKSDKERDRLRDLRKTRKDFSDKDADASIQSFDSLMAMGVEPKDATSAINGLIEKGFRGDDLAGAFKGFSGASAVKSANDGGGNLGDLLRGQLEDLLEGKGAVLIDILDDGKINSPTPQPAPNPSPAPGPGSSIPTNPPSNTSPTAPPMVGGVPVVTPVKVSTPVRSEKKGKVR